MESLIGKEVVAFKFERGPEFIPSIEKRIGQIGKIIKQNKNYCVLQFADMKIWSYPYPEILDHLFTEEEIDINALFEQIKNI